MKNKRLFSKIVIAVAIIGAVVIGSILYISNSKKNGIYDFDIKRDKQFILESFDRDMYWLVENPEFSAEFMMKHMSPNKKPEFFGKLNFKVLFENNKPAGFTTYYKKKFYEGTVQFIYVHPDFRNKGYAKKLVLYGANELFKQGASVVKLVTRVTNEPAIKAYTKAGFKDTGREDGFINFEIQKNK